MTIQSELSSAYISPRISGDKRDNIDIIYFTLFPWENAYSSVSLSLTREFAKQNRVFYINHPYTIKDFIKGWKHPMVKARRKDMLCNRMRYETIADLPSVIAVQPPLTLPINWMKPGKLYDKLFEVNNRIIVNTIRKVIKDFNIKNFVYLNCFNPYYVGALPKALGAKLSMYQCIDDMMEEEYTARHGARLEQEAMKSSDVAFVTSLNLYRLKKHINPNTYVLHNAVDISIFEQAVDKLLPRPKELLGLKNQIIGFTGNINEYRLDYQLINKIAEEHSDKTLVKVGPLNSDCYKLHGLDKMPNVILTGGKNIKELPAFLQHFDVTIIPFLKNKLTESIYPLKINEYLAAGKPVIATNFSEDMLSFADVAYIAENETDFIKNIDKAIAENSNSLIEQRILKAKQNTWTERVNQFWDIVNEHLILKDGKKS